MKGCQSAAEMRRSEDVRFAPLFACLFLVSSLLLQGASWDRRDESPYWTKRKPWWLAKVSTLVEIKIGPPLQSAWNLPQQISCWSRVPISTPPRGRISSFRRSRVAHSSSWSNLRVRRIRIPNRTKDFARNKTKNTILPRTCGAHLSHYNGTTLQPT